MVSRKPCIKKARNLLQWRPKVGLEESLRRTLLYFLKEKNAEESPIKRGDVILADKMIEGICGELYPATNRARALKDSGSRTKVDP
jgi:hypothetical protein